MPKTSTDMKTLSASEDPSFNDLVEASLYYSEQDELKKIENAVRLNERTSYVSIEQMKEGDTVCIWEDLADIFYDVPQYYCVNHPDYKGNIGVKIYKGFVRDGMFCEQKKNGTYFTCHYFIPCRLVLTEKIVPILSCKFVCV